ncbi:MICOS complex subunit mic10 [Penicillium subrubescens]|uniref:MICOS complex subunit MIC10 n=1 Tax=Penicillium subrubescens TaxID=1316194 RepID=A0A1Q5U236_9EURO|nr:MICOS complex subunit mic10 [Penicillium subrubescens]
MADSSETRPVARATKPVSEALLNEKWDRAISSMIIKSSLGLSFGVVFSVLLFKRRAWPAWVGLGFGAGRAWEEADGMFMSAFCDVTSPEFCLAEIQSFPAASAVALTAPKA